MSSNGSHAIDIIRYMAGGDVEWVVGELASDEAAASGEDLMGNGYLGLITVFVGIFVARPVVPRHGRWM